MSVAWMFQRRETAVLMVCSMKGVPACVWLCVCNQATTSRWKLAVLCTTASGEKNTNSGQWVKLIPYANPKNISNGTVYLLVGSLHCCYQLILQQQMSRRFHTLRASTSYLAIRAAMPPAAMNSLLHWLAQFLIIAWKLCRLFILA